MKGGRIPFWAELAAALFLALALSTAATLVLLTQERREALGRERWFGVAQEIRTVLALQDQGDLAERGHERALHRRGGGLRFAFAAESNLPAAAADSPFAAQMLRMLEDAGVREVRVATASAQAAGDNAMRPARERIRISVQISDGRWLNGQASLPPRPPSPVRPLLLSLLISAAALLAVSLWMGWRLTRPLQGLARAAAAMRAGEPAPLAPVTGPAPVKAAAAAFNAMSAQVQATLDGQRALLAGLAHDLRTPITALRLRSALVDDPEDRARMEASLDDLSALTEAALAAARAGGDGEAVRSFDLAALVDSVCQDLADIGQDASFTEGPPAPVLAKADATRRALRNLIENAVRYGGAARVQLQSSHGFALVIVDDDGPGIPPEDLERVFDPFVRLEASRARETGGHGLGLTIARLSARAQGGDVTLQNRQEGGLRATLSLPT